MSAKVSGTHKQARSGRVIRYWAVYGDVGGGKVFVAASLSEDPDLSHDGYEAYLHFDPAGVPLEALVRHHLCLYIDRTAFGEGRRVPSLAERWRPGMLF